MGVQVYDGDAVDRKALLDEAEVVTAKVLTLEGKQQQAWKNQCRQKRKEEEGRDVRVTSRFWEHVWYDYEREIKTVRAGLRRLRARMARSIV